MPSTEGTLEVLSRELALALAPLETRMAGGAYGLFEELGLRLPPGFVGAAELAGALGRGATAAGRLPALVSDLVDAVDAGELGAVVTASGALTGEIVNVVTAIDDIRAAVESLSTTFAGLSAADRAVLEAFAAEIPGRLLNLLLVEYIEAKSPDLARGLALVGIVEKESAPGDPANPLEPPYVRTVLRFDRILDLVSRPQDYAHDVFGWGQLDFDGQKLLQNLRDFLLGQFDLPSALLAPPGMPAILEAYLFSLGVDDSVSPPGLTLNLRFPATQDFARSYPVTEAWEIDVDARARFAADIAAHLRPPLQISLGTPGLTASVALTVGVSRRAAAGPLLLFGRAGGSRLEVGDVGVALGVNAEWTAGAGPEVEPLVRGRLDDGKLVITGEGGDGLISEVLSALEVEADFDFGFSWTPSRGVEFEGSAGLAIDIPTRVELGPIRVDALHLGLGFADEGLNIDLAATLGAKLGPLTATVERLGARGTLSFPGEGGNLGPAQLDIGFKFPTGVGLSMDTASVKLAGFLSIDPENHRYAGAVELRIVDTFDLTAIGLITTRLPDGTDIFSLLVIITMRFPSPIHIAYNFYLAGVGGLLGLHRSVDLDRLRRGVREGAVDDILFPEDVVANMATIVSDLQEIFPPARDQFLIGPMALITWSSPPLLRVELGLIIELPNPVRIAILGVARAAIPTEDEPIIGINVAFLGTIDFDKGLLAFDASIYDSFIGVGSFRITFEGDLALRVSWGAKKDFVLSIGGFHPQFQVPAYLALPPMKRITLSLLKDNPRLSLTCYFALTTNTVQFGAELDFYFGVSAFNVVGNFGFDVLFQFSPFRFIAEVRARLAVRSGSTDLFSLSLQFELQGTTPWIAKGSASFKILFISISVRFEKTWGERREINLPEVAVLPELLEELGRDVTWKAELAPGASRLVQLLPEAQRADARIVDPDGVLTISQNLVPLATDITRFGNNRPNDIKRADVAAVRVRGRALTLGEAQEPFAPAAFREMSDRDKLASGSYEKRKSGVTAGGGDTLTSDYVLGRPVRYEQIVSDAPPGAGVPAAVQRAKAPGRKALFEPLVPGGAIGRSPLSLRRAIQRQAGSVRSVAAAEERFAVVRTSSLRAADAASASLSRADAEARLRALVAGGANPKDLDIVPAFEAAG